MNDAVSVSRWGGSIEPILYFHRKVGYSTKPDKEDEIFVAMESGTIVGVGRLCREYGTLVIRGMQVLPEYQGKGVGSRLLEKMVGAIPSSTECWGVPYEHLEAFYKKGGFDFVPDERAPQFLQERVSKYREKKNGKRYRIMYRKASE